MAQRNQSSLVAPGLGGVPGLGAAAGAWGACALARCGGMGGAGALAVWGRGWRRGMVTTERLS